MKALFFLFIIVLLNGCGSFTIALKPTQEYDSNSTKPEAVATPPVDNGDSSKRQIPQQGEALPSPSTELAPFIPSEILKLGSRGEAVLKLQQRLAELRYEAGAIDGLYGRQTWQGVVAFQKYAKLQPTGTYDLETQRALHTAKLPKGLYPELGMPRVEIDLQRGLLLFFDEQGLGRVISVSTGTNRKFCEISKKSGKEVCGVARTPQGRFQIQRRIAGWRESDLGKLYNPLYFDGGYAIHGSPVVPAYNVSHGCVRMSIATSIWFYDTIKNGTPVIVFDRQGL